MSSSENTPVTVFWFRRDLRLKDNRGLSAALQSGFAVLPIFIFDEQILQPLEDRGDRRVEFIHQSVTALDTALRQQGSGLWARYGTAESVFQAVLARFNVQAVYTNHDYEPEALKRDQAIHALLAKAGIELRTFKDQVVFEKREVAKDDGEPYTVFTPYSRKWKARLAADPEALRPSPVPLEKFFKWSGDEIPSLESFGFHATGLPFPEKRVEKRLLLEYAEKRNLPAIRGTSHLGLHLRFGTVSPRELVSVALKLSEAWLNELIWREFFMQILWNFPHVVREPFRPEYKQVKWRNDRADFERWCEGKTGYPIVDAGMRELNETGFMHNRVRMIAASFLVKHLLIDWRWGEAYFARKLLDFDLASNNGNWQWVAGCGCDAAPYFRVFNPELQAKKFDPDSRYIRHWVPELGSMKYPEPIVDHVLARVRVLKAYEAALGKKKAPRAPEPR